jgi:Icc protein
VVTSIDLGYGSLEIANAGTVASTRYRGPFENSYNIIEIKDGKINVDIKTVGGKRLPLLDLVEKYEVES